ncbi:MAG: hypothetical protein ACE5Q6_09755 [Dehalococcoidia bacterium]
MPGRLGLFLLGWTIVVGIACAAPTVTPTSVPAATPTPTLTPSATKAATESPRLEPLPDSAPAPLVITLREFLDMADSVQAHSVVVIKIKESVGIESR